MLVLVSAQSENELIGEGDHRLRNLQEAGDRDEEFDAAVLGVDVAGTGTVNGVKTRTDLENIRKHVDSQDIDDAVVDHRLRRDKAGGGEAHSRLTSRQRTINSEREAQMDAAILDTSGGNAVKRDHNKVSVEGAAERDEEEGNNREWESDDQQGVDDEDYISLDEGPEETHPFDAFASQLMRDRKIWRKSGREAKERDIFVGLHHQPHGHLTTHDEHERVVATGDEGDIVHSSITVSVVVGMTIMMAAAAGLGAVPFFFVRSLSKHWSALASSVACGVMFAASFDLIHEGQPYGGVLVIVGMFSGGLFISILQKWLDTMEDIKFGHLRGQRARRLVLMVGTMAAHAIGEGCGVGVSFCGKRGWAQGLLTTLAIGVHNVPEGLAKATMLVSQGASAPEALFWSILTCLPQPLAAVPSFMFVEAFKALLPIALGFAAGCMIWVVFAELLPEALHSVAPAEVASFATIAAAGLEGLRMAFESLEGPEGDIHAPLANVDYSTMGPGLIAAVVMIAAASLAGSAVAGAAVPRPVIFGFSAVVAAALGLFPLAHQILFEPSIPLLHTLSAGVAGVAGALLIRRYILVAAAAGSGGGRASLPTHVHSNGIKDPMNDRYSNDMNGRDDGKTFDMFDASALITRSVGDGVHGRGGRSLVHRGDDIPLPDSPSKSKGMGDGSVVWQEFSGRRSGDGKDKNHGALAVPSKAAGLVSFAALLSQAIPLVSKKVISERLKSNVFPIVMRFIADSDGFLFVAFFQGWQFTREFMLDDSTGLAAPFGLSLALRGLAAGGAVRAVFGQSKIAGSILAATVAGMCSLSMLYTLYVTESGEESDGVQAFSYPQGWTDTANAAAGGALLITAVMQFAVGMSISPKHTRFGAVLAVILLGGMYGALFMGCQALSSTSACTMLGVAM